MRLPLLPRTDDGGHCNWQSRDHKTVLMNSVHGSFTISVNYMPEMLQVPAVKDWWLPPEGGSGCPSMD